jgi:hypothetical protein
MRCGPGRGARRGLASVVRAPRSTRKEPLSPSGVHLFLHAKPDAITAFPVHKKTLIIPAEIVQIFLVQRDVISAIFFGKY